ncbi:hypothetical protein PHMEG_00025764 [Phytophthora megakarya]|uniref:Uncharacterized protein n=1 Tax=Phytophthora megakarya TaxID=4795 RepID=A0A225VCQ1_9STRA|nr:hypothetical protein PHMEG_00025764 [Phytophthora megakarya]
MDDDAEPPRSDDDLSKPLPADADLSDVRLDVLELWRMDSDGCTLTEAEDVVLGATAEDIVVHANLCRDVLCEIIRRLLCLRSLDDVDWLRHSPEEYFDWVYKRAEETGWVVGVDRPWPPVPTEPHEASEPSDGDDDISDMEDEAPSTPKKGRSKKWASGGGSASTTSPRGKRPRRSGSQDQGTPDAARRMARLPEVSSDDSSDESTADYLDLGDGSGPGEDAPWDTMFRNREEVFWFACKEVSEECPSGFSDDFLVLASEYVLLMFVHRRDQWERGHWVVFDRSSETQKQVYLDRASRQRLWYKALTKLRVKIALLPAWERKWFRCEPMLWRRPRLPVAWIPLPRGDHTPPLRDQLRALDRRDPARVYWGLPGSTSRLPESVSPATWGTVVADPDDRIFIPLPDDLPAEFVE